MTEYRYFAVKIAKDKNGNEIEDPSFQPVEYFSLTDCALTAKEAGNSRLLAENPDTNISDYCISVSIK